VCVLITYPLDRAAVAHRALDLHRRPARGEGERFLTWSTDRIAPSWSREPAQSTTMCGTKRAVSRVMSELSSRMPMPDG
jgi:hypothetical protein